MFFLSHKWNANFIIQFKFTIVHKSKPYKINVKFIWWSSSWREKKKWVWRRETECYVAMDHLLQLHVYTNFGDIQHTCMLCSLNSNAASVVWRRIQIDCRLYCRNAQCVCVPNWFAYCNFVCVYRQWFNRLMHHSSSIFVWYAGNGMTHFIFFL